MTRLRTRILPALLGLTLILPLAAAPAFAKAAATAQATVDLNSATQQQLEALPGVGAVTARKIIAGRPYASVADLAKAGVSAKTIQKITPLVTAGPLAASGVAIPPPAPPVAPVPAAKTPKTPKAAKAAATATGGMVDLNTASQKDLEALPKVGPATAKKIIAGRPYASVQDLAKAGLPAKTIETLTPLVTVSAATVPALPLPIPAPPPANSRPSAAGAQTETTPPTTQRVPPPAKGMVWVNLDSKIFHREGDTWYGRTKHGQYMSEADALKAGYREAKKGGAHPKATQP
jgi:DNA uptake protein ComE-like DNA-binding protein